MNILELSRNGTSIKATWTDETEEDIKSRYGFNFIYSVIYDIPPTMLVPYTCNIVKFSFHDRLRNPDKPVIVVYLNDVVYDYFVPNLWNDLDNKKK